MASHSIILLPKRCMLSSHCSKSIGDACHHHTAASALVSMSSSHCSESTGDVCHQLIITLQQVHRWPCWKINSFLSEISVCWSCTEKIIKIERAFSVILQTLPATRRSYQQTLQLPTVAVANLWFNKQLTTANARWRLPSPALVDCIVGCMLTILEFSCHREE